MSICVLKSNKTDAGPCFHLAESVTELNKLKQWIFCFTAGKAQQVKGLIRNRNLKHLTVIFICITSSLVLKTTWTWGLLGKNFRIFVLLITQLMFLKSKSVCPEYILIIIFNIVLTRLKLKCVSWALEEITLRLHSHAGRHCLIN